MAKKQSDWTALPHDPIEQLEDNLWAVEGDLPKMPLRRRMVIVRLDDGKLVIHSPICLSEEAMRQIDHWGSPAYLVAPNRYHRMDIAAYKKRYQLARVLAPLEAANQVGKMAKVEGYIGDLPHNEAVRMEPLAGLNNGEGVFIVRSGKKYDRVTLVFCDAIFNQPHLPGWTGWSLRLFGSTGDAKITRMFKLDAVKDSHALKSHLRRLSDIPGIVRIVVAHGQHIDDRPVNVLRWIADKL